MVQLMAEGDARFEVDEIEIQRTGLSFTVDTLEEYARRFPAEVAGAALLSDARIATDDGSLSAHFEHTVAITKDGPRILTPKAVQANYEQ